MTINKKAPKRPASFEEAFETVEDSEAAPKLPEATQGKPDGKKPAPEYDPEVDDDPADSNIPSWASLPPDDSGKPFAFPPDMPDICFMLFKGAWTRKPSKGDRWCVLWPLTDNEEKLASKRVQDSKRTIAEMSKQMIRVIDGERADWGNGSVDRFWNDIGPKCRLLIQNYYMKTHSLDVVETADFFANCMRVVSATAG